MAWNLNYFYISAGVAFICVLLYIIPNNFSKNSFDNREGIVDSANNDWEYVGNHMNVDTYRKKMEKSKLMAFRGISVIPLHISELMGPFCNTSLSPQWIDMLKESKEFTVSNKEHQIIYQLYDLPWPVTDRDFVLYRKYEYNNRKNYVTVSHHSVEDPRIPINPKIIRAESPFTKWMFEYDKKTKKTTVTIETFVDNKGTLPSWLVNTLQKSWPSKTISALRKLAEDKVSSPWPKVRKW